MATARSKSLETFAAKALAVGPVRLAFLASLLLSVIAVLSSPVLNRDGMFYVELADSIAGSGPLEVKGGHLALAFLPALIALVGFLTGLSHEVSAHLLDALLMAGTCGLLVSIVRQRAPEAAWSACLVVLAMPAFNEYRYQMLREYGFWFFSVLALWLAMRKDPDNMSWRDAFACQAAIVVAALFRPEALVFFPVLMLWQAWEAPPGERLGRMLRIGWLPLAAVVAGGLLIASESVAVPWRVAQLLEIANPLRTLRGIGEAANKMSDLVFPYKYSREEAGYVLFFGLISIIPMKFIQMSGLLVVPIGYALAKPSLRAVLGKSSLLGWFFLAHALILIVFVTSKFFLVGRYVAMLNLLAVPAAAFGFAALAGRFPRWRFPMIAVLLVMALANVVSFSAKNTQIIEAGRWLKGAPIPAASIYVDNPRVSFYAGLGYVDAGRRQLLRADLAKAVAENRFNMIVLEGSRKERAELDAWLAANNLLVVKKFSNKAESAVLVAIPAGAYTSPSMTEWIRSNTGPIE
jgi:hypothetical protein